MIRYFVIYNSFRFFITCGLLLISLGSLIGVRFIINYLNGSGDGMVQSLILGSSMGVTGIIIIMFGFISDMITTNRRILEGLKYERRKANIKEQNTNRLQKNAS